MLNDLSRAHVWSGEDDEAVDYCDQMIRIFNKAARIEREPVDTGDGVLLHTSEVHLIDLAARFPDEGLSALAVRLGITKGAISQTVKRLEEKGYIERVSPQGNNKTVLVRLTGSGMRVFAWHRAYHAVVNEKIARELAAFTKEDRDNLRKIFRQIESVFDDCPETRKRITGDMFRPG